MKKRIIVWSLMCLLITPTLLAQTEDKPISQAPQSSQAGQTGQASPPDANNQQQSKLIIPEGTYLQITMREPVSSKLSDIGDEVMATLKKDVVVDGLVLLREGTEIIGRVTLAKPAKRPLKGGMLHISFDRVRFDNGYERKLVAIVQSATDFARDEKIKGNGEGSLKGGKAGDATLRNIGTAAGIGSAAATVIILAGGNGGFGPFGGFGGISGGTAAAAGSVLGGSMIAGVLFTKGKEVRLDSGTMVRLRLERSLSVE